MKGVYVLFFLYFSSLKKQGYMRWQNQGEVAEWSKAHAWKACIRHKRIKGSNPFLSAKLKTIKPRI